MALLTIVALALFALLLVALVLAVHRYGWRRGPRRLLRELTTVHRGGLCPICHHREHLSACRVVACDCGKTLTLCFHPGQRPHTEAPHA